MEQRAKCDAVRMVRADRLPDRDNVSQAGVLQAAGHAPVVCNGETDIRLSKLDRAVLQTHHGLQPVFPRTVGWDGVESRLDFVPARVQLALNLHDGPLISGDDLLPQFEQFNRDGRDTGPVPGALPLVMPAGRWMDRGTRQHILGGLSVGRTTSQLENDALVGTDLLAGHRAERQTE